MNATEAHEGAPEPRAQTPPAPRQRRRRSWLRLPLALLLQLLLLVLVLLLWVLGTQSGLRFALGLADDLAPGLLEVERADGRVLGDLHLRGVKVRAPGLDLDLGGLDLRWSPLAAFTGTLRVQELRVRDLDLVTQPGEETEPEDGPLELPSIALPIDVELDQVLIERVSLGQPGDAPPFRIERAALSVSLSGSELSLRELALAIPEPRFNASVQGKARLTGDYPLELGLTWDLSQEPALELAGEGAVGGDLSRLTLKHDLSGSVEMTLEAVVQGVLDAPRWEAVLEILRVDLPAVHADLPVVDVTGRISSSGDLNDARVQGNLVGEAPELPDFGRLNLDLDLIWRDQVLSISALELSEDKSGALLTAGGELDLSGDPGRFNIEAAWEKLRWPLTGAVIAEARQGKIDASGTFEEFRYALSTDAWGRDFPRVVLQLEGEGDQQGTLIRTLTLDTLDGRIQARGKAGWAPEPSWELALSADGIDTAGQWPEIPVKLALDLTSTGTLDAFDYDLGARLDSAAPMVPSATLQLNGEGDVQGARLATLRIETLGGTISAHGEATWAPAVTWKAALDLKDIDPGTQWPEWKGRLAGHLESGGSLRADGPDLTALLDGLGGKLRGYPVRADGKVAMQGGDIRIQEFLLASGPSQLRVNGAVGEALDLSFDLDSPDLRSLLPDASGSIRANGKVTGTLEAPAVKLDLAVNKVAMAGQGIERLGGQLHLDLAGAGRVEIDLSGAGLVAGGLVFDSLRLQGNGDLGAHRLSAKLEGEPLALDLSASGGLKQDNAYAGALKSLAIRSRDFGTWQLRKAAPVSLQGPQVSAGPLCIGDASGSGGCVRFEQTDAGQWTADLNIDKIAFELLEAFIPDGLVLEGQVGAKASFKAAGGALTGTADVRVPRGLVRTDTLDAVQVLDFSSASVRVDADGKGLKTGIFLPLAGLGGLNGELALPGWSLADPARPDQSLRGRLQARVDDLGLVSRLVPDVTDVTGRIEVDLALSGNLSRPGIGGHARLLDGGFKFPFIGLIVEELAFDAEAKAMERIDYKGGFKAGDGRLELSGQSLLGSAGMVTRMEAVGRNLKLAGSSEYLLLASPDIRVEVGPEGASIQGQVTVPQARIRPKHIPSGTISPSPDVVLEADAQDKSAYPVELNLRLVLGKEVNIDAFGLRARLQGDLTLLQQPGKEMLGDGQLEVIDGSYRLSGGMKLSAAIGKPLTVEQGIIVFAKTPLSNPGLVLSAQREGGDVTAGVRIFGTLKNPKLTFFSDSDPGMSQAEVSNYLLTGIPPKKEGGETESSSLSLGTYVAPKLFMEYENSLGDESDKVKLRYEFNNYLEFQTETGDNQGADVFFKVER